MLRQAFSQHKKIRIGFINGTDVADVPTIILMANHARARLNWVTAHHRWIINEWNSFVHR